MSIYQNNYGAETIQTPSKKTFAVSPYEKQFWTIVFLKFGFVQPNFISQSMIGK